MGEDKTNKQQVVNSFFWKLAERFFSQVVGLLVQIILARILLPEDFGSLAIIASIISYLGIFVQSGLSAAVIQKKTLDGKDTSTLFTASMVIAAIIYVVLFFIAPIISNYYDVGDLIWPIRILSINLFLSAINSIQTGMLARQMRFKTIFWRSAVAIPISGIVGIVLAYQGFGIWALVIHSLLNTLIIVIFMHMIPELRLRFDFSWQRAKELYSFSIKILITHLVSGGGDTIRTMTIGKWYTPSNLAYYDKGYTYSRLATDIINSSVSSVLLPTFSRSQDNINELKEMARKSVRASSFIMFPMLTIVILVAQPLVQLLLTDKWLPCVPFLMLFCLFRMPGCIASIDKQVFLALGKSHIGLYYEIGLLAANLTMLFITIPKGIMEIAIGATIVEFTGIFVTFLISKKVAGYTLKERFFDLWRPVANSAILFIALRPILDMELSLIVTIVILALSGAAIYIGLAFLTKDINIPFIRAIIKSRMK